MVVHVASPLAINRPHLFPSCACAHHRNQTMMCAGLDASDSVATAAAPHPSGDSKLSMYMTTIKSRVHQQEVLLKLEAQAAKSTFEGNMPEGNLPASPAGSSSSDHSASIPSAGVCLHFYACSCSTRQWRQNSNKKAPKTRRKNGRESVPVPVPIPKDARHTTAASTVL